MWKRILIVALAAIVLAVVLARDAAYFLIVQAPQKADVIVVLAGGGDDTRVNTGLQLLQEGWAPRLLMDVMIYGRTFGHDNIDLAREYLERNAPGRAAVCPIVVNSTFGEARHIEDCLRGTNVKSVLIVTTDYHTRRALEILRARMPEYQFSIYGATEPIIFKPTWWKSREWSKTTLAEWERYLYWNLVDRWHAGSASYR